MLLVPPASRGWWARLRTAVRGEQLVPELRRWGHEVCVRAAIAAAREVVPSCAQHVRPDPRPIAALEAAEAWVLDPTDANRRRASEAVLAAGASLTWFTGLRDDPPPGVMGRRPLNLAREQLAAIAALMAPAGMIHSGDDDSNAEGAAARVLVASDGLRSTDALERVHAAMRRALAAWALHGDAPRTP